MRTEWSSPTPFSSPPLLHLLPRVQGRFCCRQFQAGFAALSLPMLLIHVRSPSPSLSSPHPSPADQKALGMSMRVERSSLEQVQGRFAALKKRKEEQRQFTEQGAWPVSVLGSSPAHFSHDFSCNSQRCCQQQCKKRARLQQQKNVVCLTPDVPAGSLVVVPPCKASPVSRHFFLYTSLLSLLSFLPILSSSEALQMLRFSTRSPRLHAFPLSFLCIPTLFPLPSHFLPTLFPLSFLSSHSLPTLFPLSFHSLPTLFPLTSHFLPPLFPLSSLSLPYLCPLTSYFLPTSSPALPPPFLLPSHSLPPPFPLPSSSLPPLFPVICCVEQTLSYGSRTACTALPCLHCPARSALLVALPACCLARDPHAALLAACSRCLHARCLRPTRALPARCLRCPRAAFPARAQPALPARCLHRRRPARALRALLAHCLHAAGAACTLPLRPTLPALCPHSPRTALSALLARALPALQLLLSCCCCQRRTAPPCPSRATLPEQRRPTRAAPRCLAAWPICFCCCTAATAATNDGYSQSPEDSAAHALRTQWLTRDAATRLSVRNALPPEERVHFGQLKMAEELYDAVHPPSL
ncbi:unnamed protein product [Closterium sp. NIES-54]